MTILGHSGLNTTFDNDFRRALLGIIWGSKSLPPWTLGGCSAGGETLRKSKSNPRTSFICLFLSFTALSNKFLMLWLRGASSKSSASSEDGVKEVSLPFHHHLLLNIAPLKIGQIEMQGRLGLHKRRSVVATASIADKRVLRQLKVSSCQNNSVISLFMR